MEEIKIKVKKEKKEVKKRTCINHMSDKEENEYLEKVTNPMHKFITLLELDCGMRVSEAITLQNKNFDFPRKEVTFQSLKRHKGVIDFRTISLTERVFDAAVAYFTKAKIDTNNKEAYVFPTKHGKVNPHISRLAVWKYTHEKSDKRFRPYTFRHQFGTKLNENKVEAHVIKELMGHTSILTSQKYYIHARQQAKKDAIFGLENQSKIKTWIKHLVPSLFNKKNVHVLPVNSGWIKFHIGRKTEIALLNDLRDKKVNTLITGAQGIGKSNLLDNIKGDKILRIDDTKDIKKTLANIIIILCQGDKQEVSRLLEINTEVITKESTKRLTEILISLTQKNEYTIIVDKADAITPTGVTTFENLRNHFHFIVAARQIEIKHASFLTNFQKIELKPLSRSETVELIVRASEDFRKSIEDFETYKNHIIAKANCNPQFTLEMIDRFRKEPFVSRAMVANFEHTAGRKELDMSIFIMIGLGMMMILRYFSNEIGRDEDAYKLFGGGAMILLLLSRNLFRFTKRKYV